MLRLFCSTLSLILLFFACHSTASWTESLTNSYISQLEYAQELTDQEQWEEAAQITTTVYQDWNSQSFRLYVLLRHSDLDKILLGFQSVSQYLDQQDQEPYLANNAQLIAQLKLLSEMEQLSLENIL